MSTEPHELSPRMRRIGLGAIALAAMGCLVTASVLAANLITGAPVDVPNFLVVMGALALAAGQLWVIVTLRTVLGAGGFRRPDPRPRAAAMLARINPVVLGVLAVLAIGGWLVATRSDPAAAPGSPISAGSTCAHTLNTHGTYTCLTDAEYRRHQAEEERFIVGILLGFYAVHVGGGLVARGRSIPTQGPVPRSDLHA